MVRLSCRTRSRRHQLPSRRAYRGAIGTVIALFVAWVIIINVHATIVVSPVRPWFVGAMVLLGGIAGARISSTIGAVQAAIKRRTNRARSIRVMFAACGFAWGMIVGATAGHRIAEVALFWRSPAPITAAVFPIRSVGSTRGTPHLSIGSQGENDPIRISKRDYDVLSAAAPLRRPWRYCIRLKRQANTKAVRIWLPSARRSGSQTVFSCPAYARWL
jgi:MFS family permease